jgi:hypothetical protein
MTEFITKEEADNLVDEHLHHARDGAVYEEFYKAINLAIASKMPELTSYVLVQKFEVVGYVNATEMAIDTKKGQSTNLWHKRYSDCDTPLYALKTGDSTNLVKGESK